MWFYHRSLPLRWLYLAVVKTFKLQWLAIKAHQPCSCKFPQRDFGKTSVVRRSFQRQWFDRWSWLHYSEDKDLAFYLRVSSLIQMIIWSPIVALNGRSFQPDSLTGRMLPQSSANMKEAGVTNMRFWRPPRFQRQHQILPRWGSFQPARLENIPKCSGTSPHGCICRSIWRGTAFYNLFLWSWFRHPTSSDAVGIFFPEL